MKALVPLAVLAATLAAPSFAEPTSPAAQPQVSDVNVHFSLEMIDITAGGDADHRVVEALAVADRQTRTHAGWKIAIPNAGPRPAAATATPPTSYSYQDVGLSLAVRGIITPTGRVRAAGHVEISGVDRQRSQEVEAGPMPQIGTFSHHFEATLRAGEATELVTVPKPDGGRIKLVLTASTRP